jgi:hypothetical protein
MKAGWKANPGEEVIVAAHDPPEQFSSLALEQFISSSLAAANISAAASLWHNYQYKLAKTAAAALLLQHTCRSVGSSLASILRHQGQSRFEYLF